MPIDRDLARCGGEECGHQSSNGALATAGGTDQSDHRAPGGLEVDAMKDFLAFVVREANIVEGDISFHIR